MPREISYTVTQEYDGEKVAHFLRVHCGFSARIIRSIKFTPDGMKLNGIKTRTVDRLKTGDIVTVFLPDSGDAPTPIKADIKIIYEDDDILVINKSPFMAMHPTHNHQGDTLANAVASHLAERGINSSFRSVGRLDKGTSGVVVCALNSLSACRLSGNIKKEYMALVQGDLSGSGSIDVPIYRPDPMKTLRACSYEKGTESALTHWTAEENFDGATLIRLNLETGRTHQIRVHMAYSGHPLAGDDMYGGFMTEIGHHLLHCRSCRLTHPVTNEEMIFEAPLWDDFKKAVEKVKKTHQAE
ncbi:MAG: RluA family pseudouridine synthase [Clostridia bacterium]|nr:RluA family pseudouridine synthase [Clostridia bacterium]